MTWVQSVLDAVPVEPYYVKDGIIIFNADCRDILPHLPKVDLVLTDPPYGIKAYKSGTMGGGVLAKQSRYKATSWDESPIDKTLLELVVSSGHFAIIWGGNYFEVPPSPSWLVWDKRNGSNNFADCELAWSNLGIAVRKIEHLWAGMLRQGREERFHPTQKPLKVMTWCMSLARDCERVIDPFMGSGTTLVAAKKLGKRAIGIELDEEYCKIAVERLSQEVMTFD